MRFNSDEIKCIKSLAALFEENKNLVTRQQFTERFGFSDKQYEVLIRKMEHAGLVEKVISVMGPKGFACYFTPSANTVELAREIDHQTQSDATPDIIDQLKQRIRRNPRTAWPLIAFLALAIVIPTLNHLFELILKILNFFRPD